MPLRRAEVEELFEQGKRVLSFLSRPIMATSISSFNWLMRNYEEALNILKHGDKADVNKVLNCLMDAWKNRDGAIGLEISVFFSQALLTQTDAIIALFQNRKQELASFLDRMPYDVFTNYTGDEKSRLSQLRDDLIQRLNAYENQTKDDENKRIAQRIRKTMEETPVREIY